MLMPQTLGENAEITIAYSTVYGGGEVFNGEKKVSLKDVVWGAGDKILYTLLKTLEMVSFLIYYQEELKMLHLLQM